MEVYLLFSLLCKHAIADLAIQSARKPIDKSQYFSKGLHLHALDHGILTFIVLIFFINPIYALLWGVVDYIVHGIIDYAKTNFLKLFNIPREGELFWSIQTIDQLLHYTTYFAITLLVV